MVKHKETESESEGTSHAEEPRFRISVCMKRFYSDERARAYVSVSARRRVRWLHRRLRRLFALPAAFRLLCRGHLLPRDEPLALLDRDDPVEVVPVHAEIDQTGTATDVVHTDETVPTAELECSPSPVCSDDLTETKRQALLMLEQYCAGDAQPPADSGAQPPEDNVTQPPADSGAQSPADSSTQCFVDCEPQLRTDVASRPRRRRVRRRRRAPLAGSNNTSPSAHDDGHSMSISDGERSLESAMTLFRVPEPAAVLRNELQPRAPRVVRPLCDRQPVACATPPVMPPAEIFT